MSFVEEGKLRPQEFKDMKSRFNEFKSKEGRIPNYVTIKLIEPKGDDTFLYEGQIEGETFKNMIGNFNDFLKEQGRDPNFISIKPINENPPGDGWVTTGFYKRDRQDTVWNCGPSSALMALSALRLNCHITEQKLARWGGTTRRGTAPANFVTKFRHVSDHCNTNINYSHRRKRDISWATIIGMIRNGREFILHLRTLPDLRYDVNGRRIWNSEFGHYVYLVGYNTDHNHVRIYDPTKGLVDFTAAQMDRAMGRITWAGSLHIIYRG